MKKFSKAQSYVAKTDKEAFLAKAFLTLKTDQQSLDFLRDLLTPAEIEEFSNRLEIAKLLVRGASYQEIAKKTGTSTTTVTRVAQWVFSGCGGYEYVLEHLEKN